MGLHSYACSVGMCVCVCSFSPPYTHTPKWLDHRSGSGVTEHVCSSLFLYWVAGVASPFHTVNLLEAFSPVRFCSHNSDLNLFWGTIFVAVIWQTERYTGSFSEKALTTF